MRIKQQLVFTTQPPLTDAQSVAANRTSHPANSSDRQRLKLACINVSEPNISRAPCTNTKCTTRLLLVEPLITHIWAEFAVQEGNTSHGHASLLLSDPSSTAASPNGSLEVIVKGLRRRSVELGQIDPLTLLILQQLESNFQTLHPS